MPAGLTILRSLNREMKHSRKSQRKSQRKSKSQRGGGWGYTGPAFTTALGVPLEARTFVSDCLPRRDAAPMDMAVQQQGGSKPTAGQGGGACGCMAQPPMMKQQMGGGAGTGGYGFVITDNSLGKVYDNLSTGACPPAATSPTLAQFAAQAGGAAPIQAPGVQDPKLYGVVSYPVGYGYTTPVQVNGQSYMDPARYDRTCSGGGRRRRQRKSHRKSHRKTRKGGRKH